MASIRREVPGGRDKKSVGGREKATIVHGLRGELSNIFIGHADAWGLCVSYAGPALFRLGIVSGEDVRGISVCERDITGMRKGSSVVPFRDLRGHLYDGRGRGLWLKMQSQAMGRDAARI